MAADPNIYFQGTKFSDSFKNGVSMGQSMREMRAREEQKARELKKNQDIQDSYREGLVQNPDGTFSVNQQATLGSLLKKGYGPEAVALQQQWQGIANDQARNQLAQDQFGYQKQADATKNQFSKEQFGYQKEKDAKDLAFREKELLERSNERKQRIENENKNLPQNVYQAATFGKRVEDANSQIEELLASGYDPTSATQATLNKLSPEFIKSEDAKLMDQSQRNFINAVLRRESGASIAPSEFESANKQYFPQVGDSPAVLEQKARNRQVALAGLKSEGAKAWGRIEGNLPPNQSGPKVGATEDGYVFLGGNPSDSKNWKKR